MATAATLSADVVICTYLVQRWDLLERAVGSVLAQTVKPGRLILVVDHNDVLLQRCRERWLGPVEGVEVVVTGNEFAGRLASARNTGLLHTSAEIVAFLDDDAEAAPDWLEILLEVYRTHPAAAAVGGAPLPDYGAPRPAWFPPEFDWVFGCHYPSLPDRLAPIKHLIGANMSVRREAMLAVGGIHADGPHDDMDLSHRIFHRYGSESVLYEPRAQVRHFVPPERLTWSYFWRRCFSVNRSKVAAVEGLGEAGNIRAELRFAAGIFLSLVPAVIAAAGGRPERIPQALASVAGLGLAGAGYAVGTVRQLRGGGASSPALGLTAADVRRARSLEALNRQRA